METEKKDPNIESLEQVIAQSRDRKKEVSDGAAEYLKELQAELDATNDKIRKVKAEAQAEYKRCDTVIDGASRIIQQLSEGSAAEQPVSE